MGFRGVRTRMEGESQPFPGERDRLQRSTILADPRQRRILAALRTRSPATLDELGRRLATTADRNDGVAVDSESIRADLRHRCLPGLEAVGWIERGPDGACLDEPLFDETVPFSPPDLRAPDDPAWDVVSALLARPYRQDVLSVVASHDGGTTVEELAAELRDRDRDRDRATRATRVGDERTLRTALHHVDLPKLAGTGVIDYDPDRRRAVPTDRLPTCIDRLELGTK